MAGRKSKKARAKKTSGASMTPKTCFADLLEGRGEEERRLIKSNYRILRNLNYPRTDAIRSLRKVLSVMPEGEDFGKWSPTHEEMDQIMQPSSLEEAIEDAQQAWTGSLD